MSLAFVKETLELDSVTTDDNGNAYVQKRINLREGQRHQLLQVDMFQDGVFFFPLPDEEVGMEVVISPYPAIPTQMNFSVDPPVLSNRYESAGQGSVLFKANANLVKGQFADFKQFPSAQIASGQYDAFYSNHVYVNVHVMGTANTTYQNLALSFYMVLDDTRVNVIESTMGILAESHNAMCMELMSQGHMVRRENLYGNTFPMWRYGGIRPEFTFSAEATGSFFLPISTRDAETMSDTGQLRQVASQSRQMAPFDEPFGDRFPDWLRIDLPAGVISGAIRDQWPPTKYHDNGNLEML